MANSLNPKSRLDEISLAYQHATVLLTACKMGVFAALGGDVAGAPDLARRLGLDPRALETLLLALCADGFLVREGEGFRVAPQYAPYLLPNSPGTQANILNHHFNCLQRWARLPEVLQTGKPIPRGEAPLNLRDFICGMADISKNSSAEAAQRIDLARFRRMLDLGGGPATSSIVFAQNNPDLTCVVFDLEDPIEIAREKIVKAGLSDRIETRVGDYFTDEFGENFDLVYISNIVHSMGPEETAKIVAKAHRALLDGGTIIIKDFFLDDSRTQPVFPAFFSINMLVATERGKSYTFTEMKEILSRAGFGDFDVIGVAGNSSLLIARKN